MTETLKRRLRCAVYTRKSTDEGMDQEYNSIDAQRDAGHAYIASQRAEGWVAVSDDYDDPAYSGGHMERPASKRLLAAIDAEWRRTADALAQITGHKQRLANNAALQRSIRHRFPYIDPLHHLQVELIRRYRAGNTDERIRRGIHISINGIAAGLRNTG